jgi:hypothetical protein
LELVGQKDNAMMGPKVKLELSCFECVHCHATRYTCQGDSGSDVTCAAMDHRRIGDTTWATPDWCPFRESAIKEMIAGIGATARGT